PEKNKNQTEKRVVLQQPQCRKQSAKMRLRPYTRNGLVEKPTSLSQWQPSGLSEFSHLAYFYERQHYFLPNSIKRATTF
ncbi:hypothetical protein PSY31_23925, partial [Shigella flexneri]|nr:hypothetical protein [Shigella flexneri]